MASKPKNYTEEFKKQIVVLYHNGKSSVELSREYGVSKASVTKWIYDYNHSGCFKTKDNKSTEENEILQLRKKIKQLEMENYILKQSALIMAQR